MSGLQHYSVYVRMNNHIYSTLFKIQERKADRRSKEIEQRKESQNTHKTRTCDLQYTAKKPSRFTPDRLSKTEVKRLSNRY